MKQNNNILYITIIALIVIISLLAITQLNKKGELLKINYKEIKEKIDNKESFVLIVSKSTCSHCATYKPKIKQIAKEYNINIYYIDYDTEKKPEEFLKELKLDGTTPITIFFKKGKEKSILNRLEGDLSKQKVIEKLKKMGFIEK